MQRRGKGGGGSPACGTGMVIVEEKGKADLRLGELLQAENERLFKRRIQRRDWAEAQSASRSK